MLRFKRNYHGKSMVVTKQWIIFAKTNFSFGIKRIEKYFLQNLLRQSRWLDLLLWCAFLFLIGIGSALAGPGAGDLPFATTLETLQQGISGPFLMSAAIIMIVVQLIQGRRKI